jgi:hypothetical protein
MSSTRKPPVTKRRSRALQRASAKYAATLRSTGTGERSSPVMNVLVARSR